MRQGPVQIAYFVPDIERAALDMAAHQGAGPFFLAREIELASATHRGLECRFVHSSAYGQWGELMLELVQQDVEGPSPFRDIYPPGESGLHHLAYLVDNLEQAIQDSEKAGFPLATRATTTSGVQFAFADATVPLGHMLELYEPSEPLTGFYRMVRDAAKGWRGEQPLREL